MQRAEVYFCHGTHMMRCLGSAQTMEMWISLHYLGFESFRKSFACDYRRPPPDTANSATATFRFLLSTILLIYLTSELSVDSGKCILTACQVRILHACTSVFLPKLG